MKECIACVICHFLEEMTPLSAITLSSEIACFLQVEGGPRFVASIGELVKEHQLSHLIKKNAEQLLFESNVDKCFLTSPDVEILPVR